MNDKPNGPPPSYGQACYPPQQGQPPYQPYPVQAQAAPATVVVVNQPTLQVLRDYSFPRGKSPGGLMVLLAIANIISYIAMGAIWYDWSFGDLVSGFIFYLIPGILGVVGAKNQTSSDVAVACIVMSCFALITSVAQISLSVLRLLYYGLPGHYAIGVAHLFLLLCALCAFGCSIALIAIPSQVTCCRPRPMATTTTTAYPQNPPASVYAVPPPEQTQHVVRTY